MALYISYVGKIDIWLGIQDFEIILKQNFTFSYDIVYNC